MTIQRYGIVAGSQGLPIISRLVVHTWRDLA